MQRLQKRLRPRGRWLIHVVKSVVKRIGSHPYTCDIWIGLNCRLVKADAVDEN